MPVPAAVVGAAGDVGVVAVKPHLPRRNRRGHLCLDTGLPSRTPQPTPMPRQRTPRCPSTADSDEDKTESDKPEVKSNNRRKRSRSKKPEVDADTEQVVTSGPIDGYDGTKSDDSHRHLRGRFRGSEDRPPGTGGVRPTRTPMIRTSPVRRVRPTAVAAAVAAARVARATTATTTRRSAEYGCARARTPQQVAESATRCRASPVRPASRPSVSVAGTAVTPASPSADPERVRVPGPPRVGRPGDGRAGTLRRGRDRDPRGTRRPCASDASQATRDTPRSRCSRTAFWSSTS